MDWELLPNELKIEDFKDFCLRCDKIYDLFWGNFAPFFDIAIYRDYLLQEVTFAYSENNQTKLAGIAWEFLMGDIDQNELFYIFIHLPRKYKFLKGGKRI